MNHQHIAPRIQLRDVGLTVGLIALLPLAWILPCIFWMPVSRAISALASPVRRIAGGSLLAKITDATIANPAMPDARRVENRVFANRIEQELQYLREYRPGGWNPVTRVVGREHIEQAMQSGQGCLLWVAPLFFSSLVAKKALYDAGISVTFLSRSFHGPSNSEFGRRYINMIKTRREERYLSRRLVMQPGAEIAAARTLRKCLLQGKTVAIAWATYGSRILEASLLGGSFPVASGAPGLAVATGAPLLPVFTTRVDSNTFDVTIEPPIPVPGQVSRQEAVSQMVREYSSLLEPVAINDPAALTIWRHYVS